MRARRARHDETVYCDIRMLPLAEDAVRLDDAMTDLRRALVAFRAHGKWPEIVQALHAVRVVRAVVSLATDLLTRSTRPGL